MEIHDQLAYLILALTKSNRCFALTRCNVNQPFNFQLRQWSGFLFPNFTFFLKTFVMKIALIALLVSSLITASSIYDFKVEGLEGGSIDFSQYKGKKIMIVNTASK